MANLGASASEEEATASTDRSRGTSVEALAVCLSYMAYQWWEQQRPELHRFIRREKRQGGDRGGKKASFPYTSPLEW